MSFKEYTNHLLEHTEEWKGKGDYLNDKEKEEYFDRKMFIFTQDQYLSK